jgi:hypothetical protein
MKRHTPKKRNFIPDELCRVPCACLESCEEAKEALCFSPAFSGQTDQVTHPDYKPGESPGFEKDDHG